MSSGGSSGRGIPLLGGPHGEAFHGEAIRGEAVRGEAVRGEAETTR